MPPLELMATGHVRTLNELLAKERRERQEAEVKMAKQVEETKVDMAKQVEETKVC